MILEFTTLSGDWHEFGARDRPPLRRRGAGQDRHGHPYRLAHLLSGDGRRLLPRRVGPLLLVGLVRQLEML
ncbi:MAG TPA: hypothetical protein VHF70_07170 [Rubrobacteraceae bacterium]|nr:hypothetical protein [Rubrobacteraceae bacterium]